MNNNNDISNLLSYCKTDRQKDVVSLISQGHSHNSAGNVLGIDRRTVGGIIKRIKEYADNKDEETFINHSYNNTSTNPLQQTLNLDENKDSERLAQYGISENQYIRGHSLLLDEDGTPKLEWIKTSRSYEEEQNKLMEVLESLKDKTTPTPRVDKTLESELLDTNLLNCFILSDAHIGMFAWDEETKDDNWDMDIAIEIILEWFKEAISQAPNADTAILAQLGDLLHWDGLLPVTPTSGHILDADTRFQKLIRVSMKVITNVIGMLLQTHESVHVIMAEGNHDLASSAWLRELFSHYFSENPRVTIDTSPDPYYCYEHGDTSLFFHHGHKSRINRMTEVFVGKFRNVFGRTRFSYGHTGHLHHTEVKENNLMTLEQHQTLASKDNYAASHGYLAGRSASCITYHKLYGEVSRNKISADMVKDRVLTKYNTTDELEDVVPSS